MLDQLDPAAHDTPSGDLARDPIDGLGTAAPTFLADALLRTAQEYPSHGITYLDLDGNACSQTYGELVDAARAVGTGLRRRGLRPGNKVVLLFNSNRDFVEAFWACLLNGFLPLPGPALDSRGDSDAARLRLKQACMTLRDPWLLTNAHTNPIVQSVALTIQLRSRVVSIEDAREAAHEVPHEVQSDLPTLPDDPAVLLMTSGSTGMPKLVVQTHRSLLLRTFASARVNGFGSSDVSLNWLPLDHAAGLFMSHISDVVLGGRQVLAAMDLVLRDPLCWLDWIDRHRATVTWAPNFAFVLINRLSDDIARRVWDLSSMRCIANAGEMIVPKQARRFMQLLAPHGLSPTSMRPAWGMSETCSAVTYAKDFAVSSSSDDDHFVSVGAPLPGTSLRIVDETGRPLRDGEVGRLEVAGAAVTPGYFENAEANARAFSDDGWFRTGDLARLDEGALTIVGREKGVIIINGTHYPSHDIEGVVEELAAVRPSFTAAVGVCREGDSAERLAIFFSVADGGHDSMTVAGAIRQAVLGRTGLTPHYLVQLDTAEIPKTSAGKIARAELRRRFEEGQFDAFVKQKATNVRPASAAPATDDERTLADIWADVLKVPDLGVTDSFFELGGDSIRAVQVCAQAETHGIAIGIVQLYEKQTIRGVLENGGARSGPETLHRPIEPFGLVKGEDRQHLPRDLEDAYPMLALQAGMFYHNDRFPESAAYHDVFSYRASLPYDEHRLREVLDRFSNRHASPRTSFHIGTFSEPLQCVHRSVQIELTLQDLRGLSPQRQYDELASFVDAEKRIAFDRTHAPLIRFHVQRYHDEEFQFIVSAHHALIDGWSVAAMMTEILADYRACIIGKPQPVSAPHVPYREYVALERQAITSDECREYWSQAMQGASLQLLPRWPERERGKGTEQLRSTTVVLPAQVFEGLNQLARKAGVPLKSVILAGHCWVMGFLQGYAEHDESADVITGLVTSGRPEAVDSERMVGLFLNTLPFRVQAAGGTWIDLVKRVFTAEREGLPYRRYPLTEIQRVTRIRPLFETAFNFMHFHVNKALVDCTDMGLLAPHNFAANSFTLMANFLIDATSTELQMSISYNPTDLALRQIEQMAGYYQRVLGEMGGSSHASCDSFSPLSPTERQLIAVEWNATEADYPRTLCLHQLIERQVERTPHANAVVWRNHAWTYAELNARANRLAAQLVSVGVVPDTLVGVCLERRPQMLVALLAILKAGGGYVPLDPAYPADRLAYILEHSQADVLVTESHLLEEIPRRPTNVVCLDTLDTGGDDVPAVGAVGFQSAVTPANLAYCLYTSGSTGRPKGVAVEHRSLVNFSSWAAGLWTRDDLAGVLASTSFCFDMSVVELFVPLTVGGSVILAENALQLPTLEAASQVTLINTVPSAMGELLRLQGVPSSVRVVCLAGEPVSGSVVQETYRLAHIEKVFDLYGPTETTVYSTGALRKADGSDTIGRPIANTQVSLVDRHGRLVPPGVPGELRISGDGLARGYVHRPDLTAERFVNDQCAHGGRYYRTGDRARYLPDGSIQFLGRVDNQIKVRGYRIEPGEVEGAICQCPTIDSAVVLARDNSLIAYVLASAAVEVEALRRFLANRLPDYMIPSRFIPVDSFPLTSNGKVDRLVLSAMSADLAPASFGEGRQPMAPRDALESRLVAIWETVLRVEPIGVQDNFFDLGGNSLDAARLFARIEQDLGRSLPLATLFDEATVEHVAGMLRKQTTDADWSPLVAIQPRGARPPLFFVHGVGGNVLSYADLARQLGSDQPVYGLQAVGLDGEHVPTDSLESMAAHYIKAIRLVQPRGPYHVGGLSIGGAIAFEMAQQLRAQGETVGLLALLDTWRPGLARALPATTRRRLFVQRVKAHVLDVLTVSGERPFMAKARRINRRVRRRGDLWLRSFGRRVPTAVRTVTQANRLAHQRYVPKPYPGRITLFSASIRGIGTYEDPRMGWGGLAGEGVEVHGVPGDHLTLLHEPHVQVLAAQLRSCLEQARTQRA